MIQSRPRVLAENSQSFYNWQLEGPLLSIIYPAEAGKSITDERCSGGGVDERSGAKRGMCGGGMRGD
jgi:hypothetical protein